MRKTSTVNTLGATTTLDPLRMDGRTPFALIVLGKALAPQRLTLMQRSTSPA